MFERLGVIQARFPNHLVDVRGDAAELEDAPHRASAEHPGRASRRGAHRARGHAPRADAVLRDDTCVERSAFVCEAPKGTADRRRSELSPSAAALTRQRESRAPSGTRSTPAAGLGTSPGHSPSRASTSVTRPRCAHPFRQRIPMKARLIPTSIGGARHARRYPPRHSSRRTPLPAPSPHLPPSVSLLSRARQRAKLSDGAAPTASLPALRGEAALTHLKQHGLYASLGEAVEVARYGAQPAPSGAAFRLPQSRHTACARPSTPGIEPAPASPSPATCRDASWPSSSRPSGTAVTSSRSRHAASRRSRIASSTRTAPQPPPVDPQSAITEWFLNTPDGIEHGFVLPAPPAVDAHRRCGLARRDGDRRRFRASLSTGTQTVALVDATRRCGVAIRQTARLRREPTRRAGALRAERQAAGDCRG